MINGRYFVIALTLCACTLSRPLDEYHAGDEPDAAADAPADAAPADAGDGCVGKPQILTPVNGSTVGATVHLTSTAPRCLTTMILYVDSMPALHFTNSALDQDLPIPVGTHHLNINGWAGTAFAHESTIVEVTRTK
jgi:hypothetical protein